MHKEVKEIIDGAIKDHEARLHKRSRSVFSPPTIKEIDAYCIEKGIDVRPDYIWNFYDKKGWKVGKTLMVNWRSAVSQAKYWQDAPRRKLPIKADPVAEAAALEKRRQELRNEYSPYYKGQTTVKLNEWLNDKYHITQRWIIKEILAERAKQ